MKFNKIITSVFAVLLILLLSSCTVVPNPPSNENEDDGTELPTDKPSEDPSDDPSDDPVDDPSEDPSDVPVEVLPEEMTVSLQFYGEDVQWPFVEEPLSVYKQKAYTADTQKS